MVSFGEGRKRGSGEEEGVLGGGGYTGFSVVVILARDVERDGDAVGIFRDIWFWEQGISAWRRLESDFAQKWETAFWLFYAIVWERVEKGKVRVEQGKVIVERQRGKEKQSSSLTGDFIGKDGVEDFTLLDLLVAAHISIVSPSGLILESRKEVSWGRLPYLIDKHCQTPFSTNSNLLAIDLE